MQLDTFGDQYETEGFRGPILHNTCHFYLMQLSIWQDKSCNLCICIGTAVGKSLELHIVKFPVSHMWSVHQIKIE